MRAFANRRMLFTFLMGFSSGLPFPLIFGTFQAWLTDAKVDLTTIGLLSLVALPFNFKFVWAPLLDKYVPPLFNRRTGWIAIFQLALALTLAVMSATDPTRDLMNLAVLALCVSFFSASQDIVIDAYRTDILHQEERGLGASMAVLGYRLALLTSGALAFILSDHMAWGQVYLIMAAIMGTCVFFSWLSPDIENFQPIPMKLKQAFVEPLVQFFSRPGAWAILAFIILYKMGDATAGSMTTPFLKQIGFTGTQIGTVNKGFGLVATILGSFIGGAFIVRLGILRALFMFGVLQAISNLAFAALAMVGPNQGMMIAAIGIENICGGLGTTAFTAFLMGLCDKRFSATQYALLTSLMAVTRTVAGSGSGYLAANYGWPMFFFITTLFALPGLAFLMSRKLREEITIIR